MIQAVVAHTEDQTQEHGAESSFSSVSSGLPLNKNHLWPCLIFGHSSLYSFLWLHETLGPYLDSCVR